MFRDGDLAVKADLAALDRLEGDVQRHHLGQRGGMQPRVGVFGIEHLAGARIHHHRRKRCRERRHNRHGHRESCREQPMEEPSSRKPDHGPCLSLPLGFPDPCRRDFALSRDASMSFGTGKHLNFKNFAGEATAGFRRWPVLGALRAQGLDVVRAIRGTPPCRTGRPARESADGRLAARPVPDPSSAPAGRESPSLRPAGPGSRRISANCRPSPRGAWSASRSAKRSCVSLKTRSSCQSVSSASKPMVVRVGRVIRGRADRRGQILSDCLRQAPRGCNAALSRGGICLILRVRTLIRESAGACGVSPAVDHD